MGRKNFWILLIMLLAGIVLGGFMGQLANGISWLSWLNFGQSFGLDSPLVINFGILVITLGLTIKITMASIISIAIFLSFTVGSNVVFANNAANSRHLLLTD